MTELKPISVEDELCFYSLSFDITDDFVGDGVWWLQIYDSNSQMIYDKPFASSLWSFGEENISHGVLEGLILRRAI